MNTRTWLMTVGLALAGLSMPLASMGLADLVPVADATYTYCTQTFDYPPVCCAYLALVAGGISTQDITGRVKNAVFRCDWIP